jgi:N-acetylmuramoyl-L-alanine amidase
MKKKLIKYKVSLSPNFSIRKKKIKFIIIHYTGMKSFRDTIALFNSAKSKVSCHWLISRRGVLYKIVEENKVAWHAGISFWKEEKNLNNSSIGIELENQGHGRDYRPFTNSQLLALERLIKRIKTEYNLNIIDVIGHSDIAPHRKSDPGELFDWERLAKKKLAFWPKMQKQKTNIKFLQIGEKSQRVREIKRKLKKIGYKCSSNNTYDLSLKLVVEAFQRRFLPDRINGIIDEKVYARIINVFENT